MCLCWVNVECVCVCRLNLEAIQSESVSLIKQLKNSERRVLSSSEDVKEQYLTPIQVLQSRLRPPLEDLFTRFFGFSSLFMSTCCVLSSVVCFQGSLREFEQLQHLLSSLEEKKTSLSIYLCEDSSSFSTDELFTTIKTFRRLFLRAIKVSQSESSVGSNQSESSMVNGQ